MIPSAIDFRPVHDKSDDVLSGCDDFPDDLDRQCMLHMPGRAMSEEGKVAPCLMMIGPIEAGKPPVFKFMR
ncbi:hypothetical protein [Novosphingobium jiangmenense]|uniref:Uncharacterized protein n=1 Tax=Novosphingobium jiangmenense TaxID=2791981 RepID=A0ABS0HBM1_9SPHN|nr:hypothetical protein [Novosphingobium jiangmenense]MBF9149678.1 hypothetical protein [Novosphingobium jiangmenense]